MFGSIAKLRMLPLLPSRSIMPSLLVASPPTVFTSLGPLPSGSPGRASSQLQEKVSAKKRGAAHRFMNGVYKRATISGTARGGLFGHDLAHRRVRTVDRGPLPLLLPC